ncbi:DUF3833 family protein [Aureimonas sp. ME7]|uniref:DUF3833 family protein n=1 Tax=Aureimonas sp. ME7 TaxID=2744252 RepID=UPI0015F3DB2A|nr:DUF3833 family protein [Aureimonas sp. ME7]
MLAALHQPALAQAHDTTDVFAFFDGRSVSEGRIRTLLVFKETFTATFQGRAVADHLDLDERFHFEDGERLQRWALDRNGMSVSGTVRTEQKDGALSQPFPVRGELTTDGMVLHYQSIAPGGGSLLLNFRHEMHANADATIANTVGVSKFGLPLARSSVTFAKSEDALRAHDQPR